MTPEHQYDLLRQQCDQRYKLARDEILTRRQAEKVEAELANDTSKTTGER